MQLQVIYTEALESSRLFRRKALNSTQGKGVLSVWFFRRGAGSAGRMYRSSLTLLVGLRVRDDWLEPERTNPCITCHRPKGFLDVLGGSFDRD